MQNEFTDIFNRIDTQYEAKKLPKLKTLLRGAVNNIANLTNILLRKSLLKENLYNYSDEYGHEFFLPDEKDFMEKERPNVMYDRLKAMVNALEFLANNMPANLSTFNDLYLRNCQKVLNYVAFHNLNSSNAGINTRTIRELTNRLISSKDQILRRVIIDNLKLLEDNFTRIKSILDDIVKYLREKYFADIRFKVFPKLAQQFTEKLLKENPGDYINKLERFIKANFPEVKFIKNWAFDAVKYCYTTDDETAFENFKKEFVTNEQNTQSHSYVPSPREKLITIIEFIANSSPILEKLYVTLNQNLKFIHTRKMGFMEKFVEMFKKAVNPASGDDFFHIEYVNPTDKKIQNDVININDFMLAVKKKIAVFHELSKKDSSVYNKIKMGKEEALYKFLENTYFDLILTKERIIGINGEVRLRIPKRNRVNLKEITGSLERLDELLRKVGEMRRKYVLEQEGGMSKRGR